MASASTRSPGSSTSWHGGATLPAPPHHPRLGTPHGPLVARRRTLVGFTSSPPPRDPSRPPLDTAVQHRRPRLGTPRSPLTAWRCTLIGSTSFCSPQHPLLSDGAPSLAPSCYPLSRDPSRHGGATSHSPPHHPHLGGPRGSVVPPRRPHLGTPKGPLGAWRHNLSISSSSPPPRDP